MKSLRVLGAIAATALLLAGCKTTATDSVGTAIGNGLDTIKSVVTSPEAQKFKQGVVCAAGGPAGHDVQLLEQMLMANQAVVLGTGVVVAISAQACSNMLKGVPGPAVPAA